MIVLAPIRSSACWTRPWSSSWTATRSAPRTRSSQSKDALASLKVRQGKTVWVMPATLRGHVLVLLDEWERRRRRAAERAELPREVGLVGEAVLGGEAGERHRPEP